jgi:hypothetical protein
MAIKNKVSAAERSHRHFHWARPFEKKKPCHPHISLPRDYLALIFQVAAFQLVQTILCMELVDFPCLSTLEFI